MNMTEKKIYAKGDYLELSRDEMYGALRDIDPARAKGKSRAKKEELIDLYGEALQQYASVYGKPDDPEENLREEMRGAELVQDPTPTVDLAKGDHRVVVVGEGSHGDALRQAALDRGHSVVVVDKEHVHGPDCNHIRGNELPTLAGMDEFERVNPEMPGLLGDGGILHLPSEQDRLFTFRDGVDRAPTEKETMLIDRLTKNFDVFCANPANNDAKRDVLADIHALKNSGVIANPKFAETLKKGRADVRDFRRQMKMGITGGELKQATAEVKRDAASAALLETEKNSQQAGA
jgi:hypothetical protein